MSFSENTLLLLNSSPSIWRAMEEFHFRLAKTLVKRGAKVVIVLAKQVPPEIQSRFEASGATVHFLAYRDRWRFFWGLRRLLKQNSITTVHIRFFRLNQFVPWLVRLAGAQRVFFTDAEGGESEATGLKRTIKRLYTRLTTAPTNRIIAISNFVKERLIENGVAHRKVHIVYNGIDLTRFTPDSCGRQRLATLYGIESDETVLATVSRLWAIKGVDVLLRACRVLKDERLRFRFLIAGSGPQEQELKMLCTQLGLDDHVVWLGETAEPESMLRGTDIFLLGTTGEAFGNVLVEAMASGAPVVAARSGAVGEIVIDRECGLLVEPNSPGAIADAIGRLSGDPEMRFQFGRAAEARACQFSVNDAIAGTLQVYDSL